MDAKGSTEDAALAEAEKEARELEEQLLLKPRVSAAMRRIFEDYSGKHPGEVAEDTDRAPSAEEVAVGEVREAIPPAAELRCSTVPSADATGDEARGHRGAARAALPEGLDKGEDRGSAAVGGRGAAAAARAEPSRKRVDRGTVSLRPSATWGQRPSSPRRRATAVHRIGAAAAAEHY